VQPGDSLGDEESDAEVAGLVPSHEPDPRRRVLHPETTPGITHDERDHVVAAGLYRDVHITAGAHGFDGVQHDLTNGEREQALIAVDVGPRTRIDRDPFPHGVVDRGFHDVPQ
jgi:hypothetical protein